MQGVSATPVSNRRPDATDERILRLLVRNARASYRDLGAAVGLSANAVAQRMRRLEAEGVLRGYTAVLEPSRQAALSALVHLRVAADADADACEAALAAVPAVVEVLDLAGSVDYEVRLECATQQELYAAVQAVRLAPGVTGLETRTVLRHVLDRRDRHA
ncbi:Lrp/AsnC family transcriptional regulator [Vallicoccus soli]|uniref:Lrp/AsnC family transcriptional regulator n=1 Tax=Vallicoccus soli TaxID=2339232 RepID=A0A3A3ZHQ7_9ACTN|nr:Lrp/AsnC family transcriptional regulator [Vallicoccus soli]